MFYFIIAAFVLGYMIIALEHPLKLNKAATALMLGTLVWTLIMLAGESLLQFTGYTSAFEALKAQFPETGYAQFISHHELITHLGDTAEILFFLLGAMTIVEIVDKYEGFHLITDRITTRNKRKLLWTLSFLTFFLSAVLDNLTTSIVMCALLRKLVSDKKERWFFAGMIILAANAGGAWSPIGDVTTIMLWIGGQVTAINIIIKTILPSLVAMIVPLIGVSFLLKGEVSQSLEHQNKHTSSIPSKQSTLILIVGLGALLFTPLFKTLTHLPPYLGMLFGLGILWTITEILHARKKVQGGDEQLTVPHILRGIDFSSILFFLGILMAVAGLQTSGILNLLSLTLEKAFSGNIYAINLVIGALSAIVDNVPLVAGAMGMYSLSTFPTDHIFWELLAYCAGTGGSILIIGSAAGVAIMGMEKIDFIWYMKKISIWAIIGYLSGAGTFYLLSTFVF